MGTPYSDIRASARLRPALDRYIQYLNGELTRPSRVGTQGARTNTKTVYLTPFGFDIAVDDIYSSTVDPNDYSALSSLITGNGGDSAETLTKDLIIRPGFIAARFVTFLNASRAVEVKTSDITGLEYLKYNGTRRSCPFGRATATDDQDDVFAAAKAAFLAANTGAAVKRASLSREKLKY